MPLNSVQEFVRDVMNGLVVPTIAQPLEAYITPPTVEELDGPKMYIFGARLLVNRQTAPRGPGFQHYNWTVDGYISYETTPDSDNVDSEFPLIIDAVMQAARSYSPMPRFITDSVTGQRSQILSFGEQMQLEYPPERTPSTLRMLYYTCRIGFDIYEAVQG